MCVCVCEREQEKGMGVVGRNEHLLSENQWTLAKKESRKGLEWGIKLKKKEPKLQSLKESKRIKFV